MITINLSNKNLNQINDKLGLSILLNQDGFSYCIYNLANKDCLALMKHTFQTVSSVDNIATKLEDIVTRDLFLKKSFDEVKVSYITSKFTIVPNELFSKEDNSRYLSFLNSSKIEDETFFNKPNKRLEANTVFSIPTSIVKFFDNLYPNVNFYSQHNSIIEYALKITNKTEAISVILNVNNSVVDICVVDENKILFLNTFFVSSYTDIVYFVANIYSSFNLNLNINKIVISGDITMNCELYKSLIKFVGNVEFVNLKSVFNYKFFCEDINYYNYFNLLILHQCE